MFANRLAKNMKRLRSWAQREEVTCYRLYDADMPEYAFAIDLYRDARAATQQWLYVQEYAAPAEIELEAVRRRRGEVLATLPEVTGVAAERIRVRTRRRTHARRAIREARRAARTSTWSPEGGLKFRVNFEDYLDTGIFLDHRLTRARLRAAARGARFLNLFAYTGTASVYAASGGAAQHDQRRHVAYLPGVGAAQPVPQWPARHGMHQLRAGRLPRMAREHGARAPSATSSSSSIRRHSPTPSAWRGCSMSSATTRS